MSHCRSLAALSGPNVLAYLRSSAELEACQELAAGVSASDFEAAFHAPLDELMQLVELKTCTIPRLLELLPEGTLDPTPSLYDGSFLTVAGMLAFAGLANAGIRPVAKKHFLK